VGSEEPGEKGRSDDKARDARPPERHGRGEGEDDPGELTQVSEDGEIIAARELTVAEKEINRPDHSLLFLTCEAVRITGEHTDCDSGDRVEGAEEHHPENESCAGDRCGDRLDPVQQHPHTQGKQRCEDELGEVDEDPLVRLVGDPLHRAAARRPYPDGGWQHYPEERRREHQQFQGAQDEIDGAGDVQPPAFMVISDSLVTVASGSCKALGRRDVMGRPIHIAAGVAALALLALGGTALGHGQGSKTASNPIRLADATMIVEVNATDGDAGLQVFLDGEPWRSMRITSPDGRTILAVKATGRLRNFGLTELFSESSEPPFDEFPLRRFRALFPEGRYSFVGTTVEGDRLVGRARLTHDIPHGPEIVSPADGAAVAPENVVASWKPVTTPAGIRIAGYRAIVTREDPLRVFSVDLPASVHSVTVPPQFLESGTEYKLEVQAIEAGGNQTLTEIMFVVT
jgi:hypothetical protein